MHEEIPKRLEDVSREVVDSAFKVHKTLGPGLLESAYQACLKIEIERRGLACEAELALPITYESHRIEAAYRVDLMVEQALLVELKAVESLLPVHSAQLLTYMRLSQYRMGLLINFNVPLIKSGIKRLVI